jgi:hypothetical protein
MSLGVPYGAAFDPFLVVLAVNNSVHVNSRRYDRIRVEVPGIDDMLNLGYGNSPCRGHHRVEVTGGFPVDQITRRIAFPCFDKRKIGGESVLKDIFPAIEYPSLFAFRDNRSDAGGGVERWNTGSPGADPFGKRSFGGPA